MTDLCADFPAGPGGQPIHIIRNRTQHQNAAPECLDIFNLSSRGINGKL